ncbi:MAG: MiaB/RimO family radical SAM methylthiotransferase [Gemmatimonadetes bacterium]|nr:MiaB/RimO family radical SAM methylthiotransferase [Gemmatimonadota bacterium]
MRLHFKTFGCKANQYDTERMRQAVGAGPAALEDADVCVVNTCTVTNAADAGARRFIRRAARVNPGVRIVVAGCSAVLRAGDYRRMAEVDGVVAGHDPGAVRDAVLGVGGLVQLGARSPLDRGHLESVGATVLRRRAGATRGWLKVQDGCDRKCAFCATRLARGRSRSRHPDEVVAEARVLARTHPELVITGVHIGHYGRDLAPRTTLTALVRRLLDEVAGTSPAPRFRLGSIEATEIDDGMLGLLAESGGRLAPHLHMPLQSGADPVLRNMRRWHTREQYRRRALEIAARISPLGLGADIITGFPGESPADHADTIALVRELPFTYLHVFPYSPRDGTAAMRLDGRVPERVSRERGRELRDLAAEKAARYTRGRGRAEVEVVMEGRGGTALTGDYLRVEVGAARPPDPSVLHRGRLSGEGSRVVLDTPGPRRVN